MENLRQRIPFKFPQAEDDDPMVLYDERKIRHVRPPSSSVQFCPEQDAVLADQLKEVESIAKRSSMWLRFMIGANLTMFVASHFHLTRELIIIIVTLEWLFTPHCQHQPSLHSWISSYT
jgi:hypothetical protein